MIYACDACRFLFERTNEPERCPDCGKFNIRPAVEEEIKEYENRLLENERIYTTNHQTAEK